MTLFITSDTHFLHKNIIRFCDRPFDDVEEMTEELIKRWNEVVGTADTVLHLGDFGFQYNKLKPIVDRLNGSKILVRGNHDFSIERMTALGFHCVTGHKSDIYFNHALVNDYTRRLICSHRPCDMSDFSLEDYEMWGEKQIRLVGHEHNNAPLFIRWVRDKNDTARPILALNMSCEHWNYYPAQIEKVAEVFDAEIAKYL